MLNPEVSILMPVKNAGPYLKECLDSIVTQNMTSWELIVVDDHSSDHSLSLLLQYSEQDERIKTLTNTGNGIIDALKIAYHQAKGSYITRMDADDIMHRQKLFSMNQALKNRGYGHVAVGFVEYFSNQPIGEGYRKYAQWLNDLTKSGQNYKEIYRECSIPSPCWMTHRDDLNKAGAFDNDIYPEDYDLAFRFKKAGLAITPILETLHYWRDHPNRTSRNHEHYADNRFTSLKVHHFLDQDKNDLPLIIWGAGRKGKQIAQQLSKNEVAFSWICNNQKKIGKEIYGNTMQDLDHLSLSPSSQVIIAVSSPHHQKSVKSVMQNNPRHDYFRFT